MERKTTLTRGEFIDLLAEAGASPNTIAAMFNAYTAGAKHMREVCADLADECVSIEELGDVIRSTEIN